MTLETREIVTEEMLLAFAGPPPAQAPAPKVQHVNGHVGTFDLDTFIAKYLPGADGPTDWNGGRRWTLLQSPMCDHHDGAAFIGQKPSGAIVAKCHHNSCSWDWHVLRAKLEPRPERQYTPPASVPPAERERLPLPEPINVGQLIADHPRLKEPVIGGLLRRGETANIIAAPKVGKSWLGYSLALSIVMGLLWLGRFQCRQGRVLIIDNELHETTLASRIPTEATGLGIARDAYAADLDVLPLRGRLTDLHGINQALHAVEPGTYDLIILDALYRALPLGTSENDNASMASLFNTIDQITARLNCAWVNIHHASKGDQSGKGVTDIGAGAGAQSRAADAHIVLRQHEEENVVVMEAVVRSFAPVEPLPLRWTFPVWTPADGLDPAAIRGRGTKQEERQGDRDRDGLDKIRTALLSGPLTTRALRRKTGLSRERLERLLDHLEAANEITSKGIVVRGKDAREYCRKGGDHDLGG